MPELSLSWSVALIPVPGWGLWTLGFDVFLLLSISPCRHFLFKTGTGTTPLFSTATPGYTMATGSVYSPPTRPLPRTTLSRSAFKFKKTSKFCSWRSVHRAFISVKISLLFFFSFYLSCLTLILILQTHTKDLQSQPKTHSKLNYTLNRTKKKQWNKLK